MLILPDLPDEVLTKILEKVGPGPEHRKPWRRVCKNFLRVEALSRKSLKVLRIEYLFQLLQKYVELEEIDLSVCPRVNQTNVMSLLSRGSLSWTQNLKRLVLSCTSVTHAALVRLIQACPLLESIDVSSLRNEGGIGFLAYALSKIKKLRELNMDNCPNTNDSCLDLLFSNCTGLELLSLKGCRRIRVPSYVTLGEKLVSLKHLDISGLPVTTTCLQSIAGLPKLEELYMVGCRLYNDDGYKDGAGLQSLADGCPSLKVFDVSECDAVTPAYLMSIINEHPLLEQLTIGGISEFSEPLTESLKTLGLLRLFKIKDSDVPDNVLNILGSNCKLLMELALYRCREFTEGGVMSLISGCQHLERLDLSDCQNVNDQTTIAITMVRCLVSLNLKACDKVTNIGLELIPSCLLLEELDLTGCGMVDDLALEYVSKCSHIVRLKLGKCKRISDNGLAHIARNCPKLTDLDLSGCVGIGDYGLQVITDGCRKLTNLNLSFCKRITDKGMEHVSHLANLYYLDLCGLSSITHMGIKSVAMGCKRLTVLSLKHCNNIDDSGFSFLAFCARTLRKINLSYCDKLSDKGLLDLMSNLKHLQHIKLVQVRSVSIKGLENLLTVGCGQLKKVQMGQDIKRSEEWKAHRDEKCRRRLFEGGCNIKYV